MDVSVTGSLADVIVSYLRDSYSVNLVGLHHSGRTRIAGVVADRLKEDGVCVLTMRGVAALRDRPMAALAVAGIEAAPNPALAIPQAVETLLARMPRGRSAVLIDDADDLDAVSAGVIAAAHADRRFPVLATSRPAGRRRTSNQALIDDLRPGVRLRLEPLPFNQLHQMVHELLPGTVDPATMAQIAMLSGGLPGLVESIVDTGRRTGTITQERGVWRARGELWQDRLSLVVEPLLVDLADDESEALTKLAHAGAMTVPAARELMSDKLFIRLDDLGLLDVAGAPTGEMVGVFPALAAEYLRRRVPPRPSRAGSPGAGKQRSVTRHGPLASSLVSVLNTRIIDHWRSKITALRTLWQAEPSTKNATGLLRALDAAAAAPEEFEAVLAGTSCNRLETIWDVRFLSWRALYQAVMRRDLASARALLAGYRAEAPQFRLQLFELEAAICLAAGVMPDEALLSSAVRDADVMSETRRLVAVYAGKTADAVAGLPESPDLTPYGDSDRLVVLLAHVFNGEADTGAQWAGQAMAEAEHRLNASQILTYAYIAGLGLMFAGRLDEAQALLDPVLVLNGPTLNREYYHAGVLGLAALAAGWRGHRSYCQSLAAQAEANGRRSGPFPDILRVAGICPDQSLNDGEAAWAVVAERFATGHVAAAISLAVETVDAYPWADQAERSAAQALETQSPFLAELGRYVSAVAAADADRLAECAAQFVGLGTMLYAIKAEIARALVLRRRGDLAASIRQAEAAWAQAVEHNRRPVGLFFRLGRAVGFTAREQEIALLLADGMTSQTIAGTLGISFRTVENYLSSACRKLGSTGRADLVRAVTTWAARD